MQCEFAYLVYLIFANSSALPQFIENHVATIREYYSTKCVFIVILNCDTENTINVFRIEVHETNANHEQSTNHISLQVGPYTLDVTWSI